MQGQTTLDGWAVTPCRAISLRDCADAAAACAVAGLCAELQALVRAFGDSPPAQLQDLPADHPLLRLHGGRLHLVGP
eukprot:364189-Chlamydomonas_euryale.AAC.39